MNPMVTDVMTAFDNVPENPISIAIDRTGIVLPYGQHFQGIQRLPREANARRSREPPLLVITSSSDSEGYFVPCVMDDNWLKGHALAAVSMSPTDDASLIHAGGCQTFGHFLIAGLEDPSTKMKSQIQFWDLSVLPGKQIPSMTIFRSGAEDVSTAGACGLTSFETGTVLAVATNQADTIDFYVSPQDPFTGWPFIKLFTWVKKDADTKGWIDGNFGHYQNVNLITQTGGQVFMVGFNRTKWPDSTDWMDLFTVDLTVDPQDPRSALTKVAKKKMFCTDGCSFDAGSGIFIPSKDGFDVFAVAGKSGDHVKGTTIHVNHFSAI